MEVKTVRARADAVFEVFNGIQYLSKSKNIRRANNNILSNALTFNVIVLNR